MYEYFMIANKIFLNEKYDELGYKCWIVFFFFFYFFYLQSQIVFLFRGGRGYFKRLLRWQKNYSVL